MVTEDELVDKIKAMSAECGSRKVLADRLGVSQAHLCDMMYKRRGVSRAVAERLGYTFHARVFREREQANA